RSIRWLLVSGGRGAGAWADGVTAQPAGPVHAIFGGVPRPTRLGVLNSSPYAYQKAVSLVPAKMRVRGAACAPSRRHAPSPPERPLPLENQDSRRIRQIGSGFAFTRRGAPRWTNYYGE